MDNPQNSFLKMNKKENTYVEGNGDDRNQNKYSVYSLVSSFFTPYGQSTKLIFYTKRKKNRKEKTYEEGYGDDRNHNQEFNVNVLPTIWTIHKTHIL